MKASLYIKLRRKIVLVTLVAVATGKTDQISSLSMVGLLLVVGGCFLVPLERFTDFRLGNYVNATCLLALLAAIGSGG